MTDEATRRAAWRAALVAVPVALLAGLIVFWALGGFRGGPSGPGRGTASTGPRPTTPVSMAAAPLPPDRAATCRALIGRLPDAVRDLGRRPVSAGAEQNAAYGDPPLTLACGTAAPRIAPDATVYGLSGVCWFAAPGLAGATVWTTVDRTVPVTVTVPGSYRQPGQWVIEFSGPVAGAVPAAASAPAGCHG